MTFIIILLIFTCILIYLYFKNYIKSIKYSFPIHRETYFNIVNKLDIPKYYDYFNPSAFIYKNKLYTVHRIHKFGFRVPFSIFVRGIILPSMLAISTEENDVIKIKIPDIKTIPKLKKEIKGKDYKKIGVEDARCFMINNKLYFLVNTCINNSNYCQMCLLRFNPENLENNNLEFEDIIVINPSFNESCHQKNWMPLVKNEELFLFYSVAPTKIYKCDVDSGNITLVYENVETNQLIPKKMRGSSNILEYFSKTFNQNVFVCIMHILRRRFYSNLFVIFSQDFKILAVSDEFIIDERSLRFLEYKKFVHWKNIQFVSSVLIKNNDLIVFYGQDDRTSNKFTVSLDLMEKSLTKVI